MTSLLSTYALNAITVSLAPVQRKIQNDLLSTPPFFNGVIRVSRELMFLCRYGKKIHPGKPAHPAANICFCPARAWSESQKKISKGKSLYAMPILTFRLFAYLRPMWTQMVLAGLQCN